MSIDPFEGEGELAALMRQHDWTSTPVGPPAQWSPALRTMVGLLLRNRFPLLLWWGPDFIQFYNDAYRPVPGDKHPRCLGQPARECWPEIWDVIGPMIEAPFAGAPATWSDDLPLVVMRSGFPEETHFKVAYSPVPDETVASGIGGVLATVSEITAQVYGERQLRTLRELGVRGAETRSTRQAFENAAAALAANRSELPFALLYTRDGDHLKLAGAAHATPELTSPAVIDRRNPRAFPIRNAIDRRRAYIIDDLAARIGRVPVSTWNTPVERAIVLPLAASDQEQCYGAMIAGISPNRMFDDGYRAFLELAASQVVSALRNARAYEEERERAERLAEIDRAKTMFFSNVSHELRTPLALMLGPTHDAVTSGGALEGEALAMVHRNELRLLKLVNTLLDFARIEAGRVEASYQELDIAALTADLASTFRAAIESAGLKLRVAAGAPVVGYVDREMWEKIVLNLLSNAFKHTFEGSIEVSVRTRGDAIELVVADTGVGIPGAELPRVFDRFHRVRDARRRSHEGSGSGLALVRDLVKLHGGQIAVASRVDAGTTFTLSIPNGRDHLPADRVNGEQTLESAGTMAPAFANEAWSWLPPAAGQEPHPSRAPARSDAAIRIVLADDNADMREYLARLLCEHWSVTAVRNGKEALAAIRAQPADLVISDVMMPELDGLGLVSAIRSDPDTASLPVILLSARAGEEATADGLRAGADDYIVKPFTASSLLVRVEAQLAASRTRRARLAAAIEERERLHELLAMAPAAVCALRGPELIIEFANPQMCEAWGRTSEVVGQPLLTAVPELAQQPFPAQLREVVATGTTVAATEALAHLDKRHDGQLVAEYYDYVFAPIRDPDGAVFGVMVFAVDVTQKVMARHRVEVALEEAHTANRAKDEFLALLGHELRNPLAPIVTALDLMQMRGFSDVEREASVIQRQTDHLMRLVEDLMDVARITRSGVELHLEAIELADVVASSAELASPLFERKHHHLVLDVPNGLVVSGDRHRLAQVFTNLLVNAAKYTADGGDVTVSARGEGDLVAVAIRDNGIGIAADVLPRVFDMFVQERRTEGGRGGLGLGLAIVKSLVAQHGGTVSAASAGPGQGSTFEVRLPALSAPAGVAVARRAAPVAASNPGAHRILIVDDNEDAACLIGEAISALGHQIRIAHDGPMALDIAPEFLPDVALLDIGLPAMDGYQVADQLRAMERLRGLRLVALTGYGQASDRRRSDALGFDAHLLKPVDLKTLSRLLETLLDGATAF